MHTPYDGKTSGLPYVGTTEQISARRLSSLNVNRVSVRRGAGGKNVSVSEFSRAASRAGEAVMLPLVDRAMREWRMAHNPRARAAELNRQKQIAAAKRARRT